MTYVLLYIDSDNHPDYIQGTIEQINEQVQTLWINGEIDREDWEQCDRWQLLGIEDGLLTPMNRVECTRIPYLEVY